MRINEVPEINTQMSINSPQKTAGNDDLRLFDFPNPQQKNYFSYFSSPKYLELKSLVEKYNQENSNNVSNDTLAFANEYRKNFQKEYGIIKSSSMQDMILKQDSPLYDKDLQASINTMRKKCRTNGDYYKNLRGAVKSQKIGNCVDVAAISAYDINHSGKDYNAQLVYASILDKDAISNHVAVVVGKNSEKQELKPDSIILDNWLGGVFTYKDWEKLIKKVYSTNEVNTYISKEKIK